MGWAGGSAVKNTNFFPEDPCWIPNIHVAAPPVSNSCFRGADVFFWLLKAPGMQVITGRTFSIDIKDAGALSYQ